VNDRDPFSGSLEFDQEAWHRAGCPTLESAFVRWQAAETRANAAEAELRETAGELDAKHAQLVEVADKLRDERTAHAETRARLEASRSLISEMRPLIEQDRRPGSLFRRAGAELARRGEKPCKHDGALDVCADGKHFCESCGDRVEFTKEFGSAAEAMAGAELARRGEKTDAPAAQVIDLFEALKKSLQEAERGEKP